MWFPSSSLTIDDKLEDLVAYEYMGIPYKYVMRDYRKPRPKSTFSTNIMVTQPTLISQDEPYVDT